MSGHRGSPCGCCDLDEMCPVAIASFEKKTASAGKNTYLQWTEPGGAADEFVSPGYLNWEDDEELVILRDAYVRLGYIVNINPDGSTAGTATRHFYNVPSPLFADRFFQSTVVEHDSNGVQTACVENPPVNPAFWIQTPPLPIAGPDDGWVVLDTTATRTDHTIAEIGLPLPIQPTCATWPWVAGSTQHRDYERKFVYEKRLLNPYGVDDLRDDLQTAFDAADWVAGTQDLRDTLDWKRREDLPTPWPDEENKTGPLLRDQLAYKQAVRYRWVIPAEHEGSWYRVRWVERLNHLYEVGVDPILVEREWEWDGSRDVDGNPEPSEWFYPEQPEDSGFKRLVLEDVKIACFRAPWGTPEFDA